MANSPRRPELRTDPSQRLVIAIRLAMLVLIVVLCWVTDRLAQLILPIALLALIAALGSLPVSTQRLRRLQPVAEGAAAAMVIALVQPFAEALLPYVVVPALAAGLRFGVARAMLVVGVDFAVLVLGRAIVSGLGDQQVQANLLLWTAFAVFAGALGSWGHTTLLRIEPSSDRYSDAHSLLLRLRDVSRTLPSGLDEVSLAQSILEDTAARLDSDRAALYTRKEEELLMPLAFVGDDRLDWDPNVPGTLWEDALAGAEPLVTSGTFDAPGFGARVVLPLRLGNRVIGLVGAERAGGDFPDDLVQEVQRYLDDAALRLDSGQLFTEVRSVATREERQRVAREIHDGIAQDVASLGYVVDDIASRMPDEDTRTEVLRIRDDLSRLVNELRLSIFEFRASVQPGASVVSTVADYVRSVGQSAGLQVHLSIGESTTRLSTGVETELLRIAQEAVTNARRHSHARNLWVTFKVNAPGAFLRVADDGQGLGSPRSDSYGLSIMQERADRIGATMTVRNRVGGGTVVELALGPSAIGSGGQQATAVTRAEPV